MPTVGLADVLIRPVFTGGQKEIGKSIGPAARGAGAEAGKGMGDSFNSSMSAALKNGKPDLKPFQDEVTRVQEKVKAESKRLAEAQIDAKTRVEIAQKKLAETEKKFAADSSQVAVARKQVSDAERGVEKAADNTAIATKRLKEEFKNAQDALEKASKRGTQGAEQVAAAWDKTKSKIASFAKGAALGAIGAGVGLVSTAIVKGFGRLQSLENARASLTGLGHDATAVAAIMKNANAAVTGTAFGMDEAAKTAAGAVAAGVKPGKDLERTLKLTGDAATIAKISMGEMGAIFNKVATSNKIQGDVIAQLGDAGIPIVQLLAKELGKTAEETVKLASKGEINFATFQNAMEKGMGGAALKSGETLDGAVKNTMASLGRIGANLLDGLYPKIKEFFNLSMVNLKKLEPVAKKFGEVLGDAIGKTVEKLGEFVRGLQDMSKWVQDNRSWLTVLAAGVGGLIGPFLAYAAAVKVVAAVTSAWTVITGVATLVQRGFSAALKTNPIILIASLLLGLVAAFVTWITTTKEGQAFFQSATKAIGDAFRFMWEGVLKPVIDAIVVFFTRTIPEAAAWLYDHGIKPVVDAVAGAFTWMYENAIKPVADGVAGVFTWLSESVFKPAGAGMESAFKGVGDVIGWVWTSVIKPVFDFIGAAAAVLSEAFTAIYVTAIKPAFDGIATVAVWVWNNILKPLGEWLYFFASLIALPFQIIFGLLEWLFTKLLPGVVGWLIDVVSKGVRWLIDNAIVPFVNSIVTFFTKTVPDAFKWLYENGVKPVFDAISAAFTWLFDTIIRPYIDFWVNVFTVVIPEAATWLYENGIKPVFDALSAAFTWLLDTIIVPYINAWVTLFTKTIPDAANWLYNNAIKPVFDAIGTAINWVWTNVLKPIFDGFVTFFTRTIPDAFNWFKTNVVDPVWNGISNTIKSVWENGIKPIFDALGGFIKNTVAPAFQSGIDAVKKAWDTLVDIVKTPVKFVVNTVINDGLINGFNGIAEGVGIKTRISRIELPQGFANGGYTGDGGKHEPKGVVHGGEFVFTKEQTKNAGVGNLYRLAKSLNGYMTGGYVNPLKGGMQLTQGYNRVHKGIDLAAGVGTPVYASNSGIVSWSGPGVQAPGVWGGNEIHINDGAIETWYAHLSSIGVRLGEMVKAGQLIGLSGNTGISSGPHLHFGAFAGGWPNDVNPLGLLSGVAPSGIGGSAGGGGFNPLTAIWDGVNDAFRKAFPDAAAFADMAIGFGKKAFDAAGEWVMARLREGVDFIGSVGKNIFDAPKNIANFLGDTGKNVGKLLSGGNATGRATGDQPYLYDQGGVLPPGLTQIVNRTRQPEAILNPQQWASVHQIAQSVGNGGGGDTYNVQLPHGASVADLMNAVQFKQRQHRRAAYA